MHLHVLHGVQVTNICFCNNMIVKFNDTKHGAMFLDDKDYAIFSFLLNYLLTLIIDDR